MTDARAEKQARVWRLIDAARAVARDRAGLVPDLVASTGLSREGIELAFTRHLELDPSAREVDALVGAAGDAPRVTVILSANVFVAAHRALAIALAASPRVVARPSRREPHFARALGERLRALSPTIDLTVVDELDLGALSEGEVHVYGRDPTIAAVRAQVGDRARVRGHGAGMGVALVGAGAALEEAAGALARDVIAFDQRGCLSPRVVFVEGEDEASHFADLLHESLACAGDQIPRGTIHPDERAEATRYEATIAFAGRILTGASHRIGLGPLGAPLAIPPAGRHVHVAPVRSIAEARSLLADVAPFVVAIGASDVEEGRRLAPAHSRVSALGEMQRPRFDGPVDGRVSTKS